MKTCRACGQPKPPEDFYQARGKPMPECKVCWCARVKLRPLTNPAVRAYHRKRAKTPHRRKKATEITRNWRQRNPDAYRAQTALNNALRDGKIERKPCEVCAPSEGVHAHHKDYSKPLAVVWLCAWCHHRRHALFPELEGANKRQERA